MKNAIVIKSYPNGLTISMDEHADFSEILQETETKFHDSAKFFGNARMALSLEGRELSSLEERKIIDAICQNSNVDIVCLVGKEETINQRFQSILKQVLDNEIPGMAKIHRGNVEAGQLLESKTDLLIIGNVMEGSAVISAGDIIVLGRIAGELYAGVDSRIAHFIFATDFCPRKIKICKWEYEEKKPSKWGKKAKAIPKIAYVKNGNIMTEEITKESLGNFIF